MSCVIRKLFFAYSKTKAQISLVVTTQLMHLCFRTAQLICTFDFKTKMVQFLYLLNFKPLVICGCAAQFVSDLVGNLENTLSNEAAHNYDPLYQSHLLGYYNTVMTLSIRTDRFGQTVQTHLRLLLEEQSDQGLHCFLFHLHHLTKYPKSEF